MLEPLRNRMSLNSPGNQSIGPLLIGLYDSNHNTILQDCIHSKQVKHPQPEGAGWAKQNPQPFASRGL